jgi:hypothetical protein
VARNRRRFYVGLHKPNATKFVEKHSIAESIIAKDNVTMENVVLALEIPQGLNIVHAEGTVSKNC